MLLRQFILPSSSVELTSILVPSHRLNITVFLSSGCKATVEGVPNVPNVHSSSTTHNSSRATSLDGTCMGCVSQVQSIFISGQLIVIALFSYSVFWCNRDSWFLLCYQPDRDIQFGSLSFCFQLFCYSLWAWPVHECTNVIRKTGYSARGNERRWWSPASQSILITSINLEQTVQSSDCFEFSPAT